MARSTAHLSTGIALSADEEVLPFIDYETVLQALRLCTGTPSDDHLKQSRHMEWLIVLFHDTAWKESVWDHGWLPSYTRIGRDSGWLG